MFKSMLHLPISFAWNVVRGDRWDLKGFFRAEDSGGGSRIWHGRAVLVHRHLHRAAQRRFCTTGNTRTHMQTQFLSHYWLSKFDCDDFSPVFFLPLVKSLVSLKVAPSLRLPTLLSSIAALLWLNYSWRVVVPNDQFCADTGGFISLGFFVYWCVGWIERCGEFTRSTSLDLESIWLELL